MSNKISYKFSGRGSSTAPTSSRLSYPKDKVYTDHTDYVMFQFVKYVPPFAATDGNNYIDKDGKPKSGASALNIYNNNISEFESAGLPDIVMYMPEDLGAEYGASWGGKGFTNTGADIMRTAGSALNPESVGAAIGQVGQAFGNFMQRGPSLVADGVSTAINALPGKIGGAVDINDVLGGIGGVILNPNAELLFTGFDLRSFGLNFKLTPRNKLEARMIRDIITSFKKASLPTLGANPGSVFSKGVESPEGNNRNFIGVPNLCIVQFMKGGNQHPYLAQFKPCAIKNVGVSYTPDGQYATYTDGSPVATQLTLSFTETKLVYSNEISYGGASY
ncbi:baseplate tail tube cap [Synechococcus phage S-PM2]|uniref:Baseplate tail tube cap n=1 Tax=Synechococcus phage S-PM2 TaxID=238854 RepID=Q5GQD6_BPSYP|nr:baseplate tail tube cap [Synechococcus phage S-PM2]CAF34266.1 baseplate tail tube cap [Synechococcus phage S-PM2]CFW42420.1 baseplate tail tube cap [Synechococcus phage S-PM2]